MDAFLAEITKVAPLQQRPTACESFKVSMQLLAKSYRGRQGKILRLLLGQAQTDEQLRLAVQSRWVEPRREVAVEFVRRGIETDELRRRLDPRHRSRRIVRSVLSPAAGSL